MQMKHNSWTRNWSVYFLWNDYVLEESEDVEILTIKQLMANIPLHLMEVRQL